MYFGLKGKRLRQSYGELYNLKVDNKEIYHDVVKNYLEFKDVMPVTSSKDESDFDLIVHLYIGQKNSFLNLELPFKNCHVKMYL